MAYTILQVPGDGEVISGSFLTRIRDNQEFLVNKPGVGNHFQRFTSSGTWTKPADVTWVYAEIIGGGAGGIGGTSMGGGPGWVTRQLILASTLGATELVTIGAGGTGLNHREVDLQDGGASSFGSFVARGGIFFATGFESAGRFKLFPPGLGGSAHASENYRRGLPGIGQTAYTDGGAAGRAPDDGADSLFGTGAGGGGYKVDVTNGRAGNGGIPGGGGGNSGFSNRDPGNGGRGEVRLWGW